jgi:P-type conjugative transfer protein TrbG
MTPTSFTLSLCLFTAATSPLSADAKPRPSGAQHGVSKLPSAGAAVARANAAARVLPAPTSFANAEQVYAFTTGSLYQVYTSVGKVTDIALQPGERLVGTGPVAAGDTARWIIGSTESGTGDGRQVHILVKPTLANLATNLVINSDRRTYHIELQALPSTYMASVSWRYPQDALVAIAQSAERAEATKTQPPVSTGINPARLNFAYRLEGDKVSWRPLRSFDDGRSVYIEMPPSLAGTELPPLFLIGADGKAELTNYRVAIPYLIVDRLFAKAELRLGNQGHQKAVRIVRTGSAGS